MKTKVLIKKLNPKVTLPEYKTRGSSGLDLQAFIEKDIIIPPGKLSLIPTGLSVAISEDLEIQIRPRSGLALKNGDRIAQIVIAPIVKGEFEITDELPDSIRGEGGFGSTGKH